MWREFLKKFVIDHSTDERRIELCRVHADHGCRTPASRVSLEADRHNHFYARVI